MPGAIPHIIAGLSLFIISTYYFKNYINEKNKSVKLFLLLFTCIIFSIIPDFFLIIYYLTYLHPFNYILSYHNLLHLILLLTALITLIFTSNILKIKNKPIWFMGILAILLHITMDLLVPDNNLWI
jgi:Ca2+/H+ antiporter